MNAIEISKSVHTAPPAISPRVLETAAMFGLGADQQRRLTIIPRCTIPAIWSSGGGIIFVTGPSGGGKSTILQLIQRHISSAGSSLSDSNPLVIRLDQLDHSDGDRTLIDLIGSDLKHALRLLSLAGLGDAFVMLRRPGELSDGQRYRFKIARAMELAERADRPAVILADEFGATLDRLTAQTLARSTRRWIDRPPRMHTLIAATTHDDLLEALAPDVLIWKGLRDDIEVVVRPVNASEATHGDA